jgi:hypothetical protein
VGRPAFLVENFLNPRQYPGHTIAASSTATGKSVLSLSSGRRRRALTGWFASSLNTQATVTATFDQVRAFDCLWIDRDHNLPSLSVSLSDDGFTTSQVFATQTVPTRAAPNSRLEGGSLIRTREGCLLWYLGLQVAHAVRITIPAMGTGQRPEIAGMMLGRLWRPSHAPIKPFDYAHPTGIREVARSAHAQASSGSWGSYREGRIHLRTASFWEAMQGELPIEDLYLSRGHGMVTIHDDEAAERAVFGFAPGDGAGFEVRDGRWAFPEIEIPVSEEDPVLR